MGTAKNNSDGFRTARRFTGYYCARARARAKARGRSVNHPAGYKAVLTVLKLSAWF